MSTFSNLCTGCNSNPCSCSSSCSTCSPNPCGCKKSTCCQEVVPACPTPFYSQAGVCVEDHCDTVSKPCVIGGLKVQNAFNMPACGASAQLMIANLSTLGVGSYLWNVNVGYLQIVSVDLFNGTITVQNNCDVGNVAAGTTISACTIFTVTDPPPAAANNSSPTGICLAIDFTAPDVGDCILITVTGVTGLAVGKNVGIGSGIYRIDAIPSGTTIKICNDGAGITPGTPVIAGNCNYPIVLIDANPCTNPAVTQGALVVCKDNIQQPLDGSIIGSVPVLIDPETNEVEFQMLEVPTRTCTSITCCFTIVAGFAGPYVIPVADSSQFTIGDILQIGTRTDRVTVTAIPDATTIQGTISPVPATTVDIAPGTSICIIECCEDLQNQIDGLDCAPLGMQLNNIKAQKDNDVANQPPVSTIPFTVQNTEGSTEFLGSNLSDDPNPAQAATLTFTNNSPCRNMVVHYVLIARVFGVWLQDGGAGVINVGLNFADNVTPPTAAGLRHYQNDLANDQAEDFEFVWTQSIVLIPGATFSLDAQCRVTYESGTAQYRVDGCSIYAAGIGTT